MWRFSIRSRQWMAWLNIHDEKNSIENNRNTLLEKKQPNNNWFRKLFDLWDKFTSVTLAWFKQVNKSKDAVVRVEVDPTGLDLTERGRTNIKQVMQSSSIFKRITDKRDNFNYSNNNFINQLMQQKPEEEIKTSF